LIRVRLTVANSLVLGLILSALCLATYLMSSWHLENQVDRELAAGGDAFSTEWVNLPLRMGMPPDAEKRIAAFSKFGADPNAVRNFLVEREFLFPRMNFVDPKEMAAPGRPVWDAELYKQSLKGTSGFVTATVPEQIEGTGATEIRIYSVPLLRKGKIVGAGQIARPMRSVRDEQARLRRTVLTLLPTAILTSLIAGYFLTQHALSPISSFAASVAKIESQNLNERLPVTGNDELSTLAVAFNSAMDRIESSFARLQEFTADASHEIKTPLTAILARTGSALRAPRTAEQYLEVVQSVDRSAKQLRLISDDLMLLARHDQDAPLGVTGSARLSQLVLGNPAWENRLDLHVDSEHAIQGDAVTLGRLLNNLIENALNHGHSDRLVEVRLWVEAGEQILLIRDFGPGIPPEHIHRVFDRFYRVDASRTRASGGSGLGLAIAKSIVESHGGTLTLASNVGEGTTATVRIPVSQSRGKENSLC